MSIGFSKPRFTEDHCNEEACSGGSVGSRRGEIDPRLCRRRRRRRVRTDRRARGRVGPAADDPAVGKALDDLQRPRGPPGQRVLAQRAGGPVRAGSPAVEAENLVKTYAGDVQAVKGISFAVEAGEAFGLLGPNGAGKTTTIGMLNSTVIPTSGHAVPRRARRRRRSARDEGDQQRRLPGRCGRPAVDGSPEPRASPQALGRRPAEGRARLSELTQDGRASSDLIDRPVATYSGGERRRLEIVRALLSGPEVLFLDEPTVGLDTRIRHDLFDVIATLRDQTGVTIIMTTHYLDEAERLCDRIAVIDAGTIVACDSPANFLARSVARYSSSASTTPTGSCRGAPERRDRP